MEMKSLHGVLVCISTLMILQGQVTGCPRKNSPSPRRNPRNCKVSHWSSWSACSHQCGNAGIQTRTRYKTQTECCGGRCPESLDDKKTCNRNNCQHYGVATYGRCICPAGWIGTCCESDENECETGRPCEHICENTLGSYRCECNDCYMKYGTRCYLQQCKIGGVCFPYGEVNPNNQCQDCQKSKKTVWSNNNALTCSDNKLCTRNDICVDGVCIGTQFTCRECERCDGNGCIITPGYCVIDGKCYSDGDLRLGKPCQQCNSNNPTKWTANNNLVCSDNNRKTRNDHCANGECRGEPFTCLSCQIHFKDTCRQKNGYCVIKYKNVETCFVAHTTKLGNLCQWCFPEASTTTWTKRNKVPCNDGDKCTSSDTCKHGQCKGVSFTCDTVCQSCNGNNCSLHSGFGYVNGTCACKIGDEDYYHQQLNPNNECQWCDLYERTSKLSSTWSNRPALACNDGNACTKQDVCQNGHCAGTTYGCQASHPQSSCIQSSQCMGDGTCKDIMKSNGTICRAAIDHCDEPERCNGVIGTCPPNALTAIKLEEGQVNLTLSSFATTVAFQSRTDKLHFKLAGFSVNCGVMVLKWSLIKAESSCLLGKSNGTLSPANNQILTGLNLQNTESYKLVVQASNNRRQFGLPVCSNPVTIDTSTPSGGWVHDGLGVNDLQYQTSKAYSATWGGFQSKYGIAKYEVAMYTQPPSGNQEIKLQNFANVNLNVSFTKTFSAVTDGSNVTTRVRAYTKAGLFTEIVSNGVTVDTSKPLAGLVSDGFDISSDLEYASWTTTYKVSWESFTDYHTPIIDYIVGVRRKNGGLVSSGLTSVGLKHKYLVLDLTLVSGEKYCAIVQGRNAAGLATQVSSNCLVIDHEAPRHGTVNDGKSNDIDFQSADTVFYANWYGFYDGLRGSGLAEYRYKLTDQTNRNVTSWTSVGLQTNVSISGLNLANSNTYHITVRAIDIVGHYQDIKSDGVYIDTTHPVYTGNIDVDGKTASKDEKAVVYIPYNDSLTASWPQFVDEHSGMKKYQWDIAKNIELPKDWKDVPGVNLATRAAFRSLSLKNNKEYRLAIRGINNAGLYADIISPILIPIGETPVLGIVSDGRDPLIDIDFLTNTSEVEATWQGFETPDVIIRAYFFAIGSCMKGNYHVTNNQFMPVLPPTATTLKVQGLHLVNSQRYCIKIKAENLAGTQSDVVSSNGFVVDVSPPDLRYATVLDGLGEDDLDYQSSTVELSATWNGIQDHESGIQYFEVAVSRNREDEPDVTSFINVGHNSSSTIAGLRLANDVYYIVLCVTNNAGLKSCLASDGVLVDPTPSTSGIVHDGILEPDIRYQASTKKLSANWERIWDLESQVERFEWGIRGEDHDLVQAFVDVGLQTHVTSKKTLALKHGRNYSVFLRIYNRAGVMQQLSSNGVIVDTTPPIPSEIKPRLFPSEWRFVKETGTYYSSSASDIYVTWKQFKEPESEMWYYKWSIGSSKYGTQYQPLINIGLATYANTSGDGLISFRPGVLYFVTVVGRNRADLVSGNCSRPFLFDYTPPRSGNIHVKSPSGIDKDYFFSYKNIRVSWYGFEDPESIIEKYEVTVLHHNTVTLNYTVTAYQDQQEISLGFLPPGATYSLVLKSINYASLETIVTSTPFTIDNTPPVYTGNKDELPKRYFLSDPNFLEVDWEAFEDSESPIEFYEIGIGKQVYRDDIYKFTTTDLSTYFSFYSLNITGNQPYYVTINAYNMAGLLSSLLLEEIIFDQSPPSGDNASVKDGLLLKHGDFTPLQNTVFASLENVEDLESSIYKIEYCVGSTPHNCFIKPFTSINQNKSFICTDCKIDTGMTAFSQFRVTNRANLTAVFVSDGITIDTTPPEILSVYDGENAELPDVEKAYSKWTPIVTWYGARDVQSGLRDCHWMIIKKDENLSLNVYMKTLNEADMAYNIRHTEIAVGPLKFTTNSSYFNVIQCLNEAGITSHQYSNGWSVVEQWPIPSYVIDGSGLRDMNYDVNGITLEASWGAFQADLKDPVIKYEWAIGTFGKIDDILEFTEVGLETTVSLSLLESDIKLNSGVEYYTTVRATTLSGWISNKSSNGFIVDTTPPTSGVVKVAHYILDQKSKEVDYSLEWEGFADPETGIQNYEYCLGYIIGICSTALFNAGMAFQGTMQGFLLDDQNNPFYGIVIVTNKARLKTVVSSNAVKIDFTPPVISRVFDGIDAQLDYINSSAVLATTWSASDPETGIKKCTLTVSEKYPNNNELVTIKLKMDVNESGFTIHDDILLVSGRRYVSTLACENPDRFESSKSSNGVIVDDSPPIAGTIFNKNAQPFKNQCQSSTNELTVRWTDGYDNESGIMEYLVGVGSGSNEDDIREFFSVGLARETKVINLALNSGSTYYITLEVINKAGIKSRVSSNGITVDTTPPIVTEVKLQRYAASYIGPQDILSGQWKTYDDESGIDFVEYCFGTTVDACNIQDMRHAFDNEMNVTCFKCELKHKHTYFMTVRVWNKARLFNIATTKGVPVDLTAPFEGRVSVKKTYMSCVGHCKINAEFSRFKDEESGVRSCEFSIKTVNDLLVTPIQPVTSESKIEANGLLLEHDKSYKVVVACTNTVGERSLDVSSPSIRIDNTPPEKGFVIISPDRNHDIRRQHVGCHYFNTTLRIYWSDFYDKESRIAGFRVALGRTPLGSDIIPFTYLGIVSDAMIKLDEKYGLSLGETIFATVQATNRAGLSTKVTSLPSRLISETDGNLGNEQDFSCVNIYA